MVNGQAWRGRPAYHLMGFDTATFTPIFVAARITGWTAHVMEQAADNSLIRPLSAYSGPPERHLDEGTTFADFFAAAHLNPGTALITGSVCGVKVQEVEDPLMKEIRYLDKLVDELAKGKAMEKVLRS